ncbi:hypothetical protein F5884DRAFT_778326 [Xylogone sp. PMI_703]|nr:hypothetical protein F5884DRAFT_778326 [Xylogone sp. PMI_703]
MVGVPKSKGCDLCKKRSIKCDEARPSCSQCRRGGRDCPGYERKLKFINESGRLSQRSNRKSGKSPIQQGLKTPPQEVLISIPTSPDGDKLNQIQFVSCCVSDIFPVEQLIPKLSFLGSWLWKIPQFIGLNPALDYAAECMALAYRARVSSNATLFKRSQYSYMRALQSLSRALQTPDSGYSSEILCATMLLGEYEMLASSEATSWLKHAGGAARLMQIRGAHRHKDGLGYLMYNAFRGSIIYQSLQSGEECFLDGEDWQSLAVNHPDFPSMPLLFHYCDELCNYFAMIPRLAKQTALCMTGDSSESCRAATIAKLEIIKINLEDWYLRFTSSLQGEETPLVEIPSETGAPLFSTIYIYANDSISAYICCHAGYLLYVNNLLLQLGSSSTHDGENIELVKRICMSVNYCSKSGVCGTHTMALALPLAYAVANEEYRSWIRNNLFLFGGFVDIDQFYKRVLN